VLDHRDRSRGADGACGRRLLHDGPLQRDDAAGIIRSAADVANPTRKVRRTVKALDATLATGRDLEKWPKSKKAPDFYA
jgi:hypothetical protein